MANVKISALPSASTMTDSAIVPVVDNGATEKITGIALKAYFQDGLSNVAFSGSYAELSGTPTLANVATSGSYADLTNTPEIPDATGDLINNSGFITDSVTGNFSVSANIATGNITVAHSSNVANNLSVGGNISGNVLFTPAIPGDWGNVANAIVNVYTALNYLANAKADLSTAVTELSTGNAFTLPGPYTNEAGAKAAGVQVGSFYYDNGGTVRVVQA